MFKKIFYKIYFFYKLLKEPKKYYQLSRSQNNNEENIFLKKISNSIKNKNFIEIGFHNTEFNCIGLIEKNFSGILIDGGRFVNVLIMRIILKILKKKNVNIKNSYITIKNINQIISNKKNIGCISIDIDGNDYWIIKKILEEQIFPEIFIIEYNPSFLNYSVSVKYSENFNRFQKHKSGLYHGASLKAFEKLLKKYNYNLVKVVGGINAFFVKEHILISNNLINFNSENIYKEGKIRNQITKNTAHEQYKTIKHMELIDV